MMTLHHSKSATCWPSFSVSDDVVIVDSDDDNDTVVVAVISRTQTNNLPHYYYISAYVTVTGNRSDHLKTGNACDLQSW